MIATLDTAAALLVLSFLGVAVLVPLGAILLFGSGSGFGGGGVPLFDPEILAAAKITFNQAFVSAALSLGLGTAVGWFCFNLAGRRRASLKTARTLLALPFGVPSIVAASAWVLIFGKSGLNSGILYSLNAVIVAHVVFNIPWVALWVINGLEDVSQSQREAARTLGAGRFQELVYLLLPELMPTLLSAFSQVFAICAMSFALVMILGGGPPVETLETTLYSKIRNGGLDLSSAVACALWQILMTFVPWLLLQKFTPKWQSRRKSGPAFLQNSSRSGQGGWSSWMTWFAAAVALIFLLPYLTLFHFGAVVRLFGLLHDVESRPEVLSGILCSLKLSVWTAIVSLAVSVAGARLEFKFRKKNASHVLPFLFILPAGVSTMVLGLGMFIAYQGRGILDPFSDSILPVIVLQAIFFIALAYRVFRPITMRFRQAEFEAAQTLGANRVQSFLAVEWPRWRGPLLGVFALVFGGALGEVGAVSLFYNEGRVPLSLLIFRWMAQYRFEDAQAISLFLMVVALSSISVGTLYERH